MVLSFVFICHSILYTHLINIFRDWHLSPPLSANKKALPQGQFHTPAGCEACCGAGGKQCAPKV